jgi:hypothetical protein
MKVINHPTILMGKEIRVSDGTFPHRIVLRKNENSEYTTHMENLVVQNNNEFVHDSFYWGHYFNSLDEAKRDFEERN